MKQTYLFFIIMLLQFNFTSGQIVKTKTYKEKLKKKTFTYKKESFDKYGNLISETDCFDTLCSKKDVETHIYNEKNQLVEDSIYTTKYGYHNLIWRKKYSYYDNGLLKTELKINEKCIDGYDEFLTYYYDNNCKKTKIQNNFACNDDNYFNYPIYFNYDSMGNLISKIALDWDTTQIFYKNIYSYDKSGNLIENRYFVREKDSLSLSSIRQYEYNTQNKMTLSKWIFSPDNIDSIGYSYYENGYLKEEITFPKYSYDYKHWIQYFYDTKGNIIEQQLYYLDKKKKVKKGAKVIISYEYY